jgi:hypothetical protein
MELQLSSITPGAIGIWTLVAMFLGVLVKVWPNLRQLSINEAAQLRKEVRELYEKLRQCEQECDEKVQALQDEISAFKMQRVSEQLAMLTAFPLQMLTPQMQDLIDRLQHTHGQQERLDDKLSGSKHSDNSEGA